LSSARSGLKDITQIDLQIPEFLEFEKVIWDKESFKHFSQHKPWKRKRHIA